MIDVASDLTLMIAGEPVGLSFLFLRENRNISLSLRGLTGSFLFRGSLFCFLRRLGRV